MLPQVLMLLAFYAPPSFECRPPDKAVVKRMKAERRVAFDRHEHTRAAKLSEEIAALYPLCEGTLNARGENIRQAFTAYSKVSSAGGCDDPRIAIASLLLVAREEFRPFAEYKPAREHLKWLDDKLATLPTHTKTSAAFLLSTYVDQPLEAVGSAYVSATSAQGVCPALRKKFKDEVLERLPADLPPPPSCAPAVNEARKALEYALGVLRQTDVISAASTPEFQELGSKLEVLKGRGTRVLELEARATAEEQAHRFSRAALHWEEAFDTYPSCEIYAENKTEAALRAVAALSLDNPALSATQRYERSRAILDRALAQGGADSRAAGYAKLLGVRESLKPPQPSLPVEHPSPPGEKRGREKATPVTASPRKSNSPNLPVESPTKAPPPSTPSKRLWIGSLALASSAGGVIIAASAMSLALRRNGFLYDNIVAAYDAGDENPFQNTGLCSSATHRGDPSVVDACDQYERFRGATVGMWALSGVFAAGAAVLGAVYEVKRKRGRSVAHRRPAVWMSLSSWGIGYEHHF